ncbi:hypothetical protein N7462_006055 [Penicillium macrosclerotiorum]|uniref:uncharacterized protein n=1 Tax=Penicillium macrosclerotiorum TaxID=303699 RepID=UPI0025496FD0|nr:uncharacterized protein N7462_006055 [Penicillium macrosclerotiorum]KAJ5682890.1 hypothetical protein N7462_006055 [Penicillium macrosclerotiorum]
MGSLETMEDASGFVLTSEALNDALSDMAMATRAVHADDFVSPHRAIAPAMHVAVNFRYARDADQLVPEENKDPNNPYDSHVYSRYTAPNSSRFEILLRNLMGGEVITYSTGLSAFHAILVLINPRRIFIEGGYHGCHGVLDIIQRLTGVQKLDLSQLDQAEPGDIVHVETPLNPTGEARNLAYFRAKSSQKGAYLIVDSTFAPPPLQNPLDFGADIVMHSGTKYVGGHSDMLCGLLVLHPDRVKDGWLKKLHKDRQYIGSVMGSLEGWLGIRSARTLHLRVTKQAQTAQCLAGWIHSELKDKNSLVSQGLDSVQHASLQHVDLEHGWLRKQMPGGFGPVFSVWAKSSDLARRLPTRMFVFQHATSLGGVESLMEWRAMSDATCDEKLLRISCGIEEFEDLKADLLQGLKSLIKSQPSA